MSCDFFLFFIFHLYKIYLRNLFSLWHESVFFWLLVKIIMTSTAIQCREAIWKMLKGRHISDKHLMYSQCCEWLSFHSVKDNCTLRGLRGSLNTEFVVVMTPDRQTWVLIVCVSCHVSSSADWNVYSRNTISSIVIKDTKLNPTKV